MQPEGWLLCGQGGLLPTRSQNKSSGLYIESCFPKGTGTQFPEPGVLYNPFLQEPSDLDRIFSAWGWRVRSAQKSHQREFRPVFQEQSLHCSGKGVDGFAERTGCFQILRTNYKQVASGGDNYSRSGQPQALAPSCPSSVEERDQHGTDRHIFTSISNLNLGAGELKD